MFINRAGKTTSASYIGGQPILPSNIDLPLCPNGKPMTFFFTLQFPRNHRWHGYRISFFSATDDFDENHTIPEMLHSGTKGAVIPDSFLRHYQKYFKVFLFEDGDSLILENYEQRIIKENLEFSDIAGTNVFGWAGEKPQWILDDEAPLSYEGLSLDFLFQIKGEQVFKITDLSPPQIEMDIFGGAKDRVKRDYTFFNQNETFFFGCKSKSADNRVFIVTQCD